MNRYFKKYDPYQILLLPPSLHDWLPKDHLVYFISDIVEQMDLSTVLRDYEGQRGQPPYHPIMMTKVWLYGYCLGIRSSRKLERALHEDIAFRVLSANQQPDHWTLNDFRRRHHIALGNLFYQSVGLAIKAGLVKMGHISVDGTKIKANASRHSAMSYGRMGEEEKRLRAEIEKYFEEADAIDEEEDRKYGSRRGDELPEHLNTPEKRLRAIQEAKRELEKEARRKAAEEEAKKAEDAKLKGRKPPEKKDPEQVKPKPKSQRNFTDPESRIMMSAEKSFIQGYNGQLAVDAETQIIVAAALTNQGADCPQLVPMIEQAIENTGVVPKEASADAGYCSEANLEAMKMLGIEAFIPPEKMKHSEWRDVKPGVGRIPDKASLTDRMRRKLHTKHGKERYRLRMCSVEPVIGQIKEGRGLRQFLHRGLEKVGSFWLFDCATHNILKIFRAKLGFQPAR